MNPDNAILPVLRVDLARGTVKEILGTAFFFSPKPMILSVAHVLAAQLGPDERIAVPRREPPDPEPGEVKRQHWMSALINTRVDPRHDIAVADVPEVTHFEHFPLCREDGPSGIRNVLTYDLASRMTFETLESGDAIPTYRPYTWKGYVHTVLIGQEPGMRAPAKILEVSIPTITGMSGAPLVEERTLRVAGVLFGNVARQLIPSPQAKEGERWYLPVGQALHWSHVREFLASVGEAVC